MKKTLALLLALALCLALCACGQGSSETQPSQPAERESGGALIPKTGEAKPTETPAEKPTEQPTDSVEKTQPDKPEETPEPTPEPTPAPQAAEITVTDLCAVSGKLLEADFYESRFSFRLPYISEPETAYTAEINEQIQALYDDYVVPALDYMEEDHYLMRYCMEYYYGECNGVHSILITCDSDWGMDEYWCFSFDDAGNEADNKTILSAAGLTPETFVSAARDYLEAQTDLSGYFEDGAEDYGWRELQEKTIAEDNCNAEMPMVILPSGNLGFIATIYTPAGAGQYDHALELGADGGITGANVGTILLNRLEGTYLVEDTLPEVSFYDAAFYDLFTVGDTLTLEVTGFDPESGSVYYYWAADIFPEDPAALLRADIDAVRVRVLPHCPDVMGGSYYGEAGVYTLRATENGIAFTDFGGGTPLGAGDADVVAVRAYRGDLGLDSEIPDTDYEKFDYDSAEASGITGMWSGYYSDEDYNTHCITVEMTNWGRMKLRDCVDGAIPCILEGSYYIAGENDDMAPEYAVAFNLVARNGYKMPHMGYCYIYPDGDDSLLIYEDEDAWTPLTDNGNDYPCILTRVPSVRMSVEPQIIRLEENEIAEVDIDRDGTAEELSYFFTYDESAGDTITDIVFLLDDDGTSLSDQWLYGAEVYLVVPKYSGQVFFYVDAVSDNDQHYTQIIGVNAEDFWYAGDYYGGIAGDFTDVESLRLRSTCQLLSTVSVSRTYRVGINGMPEAIDPFFHADSDLELTAKQDIDCWIVAPDTGELIDTATLSAGTKATPLRTDGSSFWDLKLADGDVRRIWIDTDTWPQSIGGADIEDCFDGLRFAG